MKSFLFATVLFGCISCCKHVGTVNQEVKFYKVPSNASATITDVSFVNDNVGLICGEFGFCSKTEDGAVSWATLNTGIQFSFVSAHMFDHQNYFVGRNGVYKSANAGYSFSEIGNLSSAASIVAKIFFQTSDTGFITKASSIYRTTDAGQTWTEKYNTGLYYGLNNLQFTSQNIAYASGGRTFDQTNEGEIVKSVDGGNHWEKILSTVNVTSIYFLSDNLGFYTNFNKELFTTTDGGINWNKIATFGYSPLSMVFKNESTGYVATQEGKILQSTDRGRSWQVVYENNEPILKIVKTPNALIAVGGGGLVVKSK